MNASLIVGVLCAIASGCGTYFGVISQERASAAACISDGTVMLDGNKYECKAVNQ